MRVKNALGFVTLHPIAAKQGTDCEETWVAWKVEPERTNGWSPRDTKQIQFHLSSVYQLNIFMAWLLKRTWACSFSCKQFGVFFHCMACLWSLDLPLFSVSPLFGNTRAMDNANVVWLRNWIKAPTPCRNRAGFSSKCSRCAWQL